MKRTSLGKSFNKMNSILSFCEAKLEEAIKTNKPITIIPSDLGEIIESSILFHGGGPEFVDTLIKGFGTDAANFRSAFKYRGTEADLIHLGHTNSALNEVEFRLPFPTCVLVVEKCNRLCAGVADDPDQADVDEMCIFMEERLIDNTEEGDWYQNHGLTLGSPFISATVGFIASNRKKFQLVPLEFHFTTNCKLGEMDWTTGAPKGCPEIITDSALAYGRTVALNMLIWMAALYSPQLKVDLRQGLKPGVIHTPRRKERVFYEHTMMTIDPTKKVEVKDPVGSHAKHRLHPVRGHWRIYQSGRRAWIKPHWRGDKELGIVTHDYNLEPDQ